MEQKQRGISLKWGLIALIALCWILPIVLILLITNMLITNNLSERASEMVTTSVENEIQLTQSRITNMMDASKKPSYDPTIRNAYSRYLVDGNDIKLYETTTNYLTQEYRYDDSFKLTLLYYVFDPDTVYYVVGRKYAGMIEKASYYKQHVQESVNDLTKTMGTEIRFLKIDDNIYMIRNIVDSRYSPYAVIVNELDTDNVLSSLRNIIWIKGVSVGLDGIPAELNGIGAAPFYNLQFSEYDKKTGLYRVNTSRRISEHIIWYTIEADVRALLRELPSYTNMAAIIILLTIPLLALVIYMFYRHVTRPMNRLIEAASRVEEGEMGYVLSSLPKSVEFRGLTEHFNSMSIRLKEQFERIYEEQKALQDSRIKALQSQINPHFLNNTLEIINWEVRMAGNAKASQMIEALSTMLNAAMSRDERATNSIEDELRYVDAYLYIISMRFGKRLTVTREIDTKLLSQTVPRLVMQPIVENAVEHGVSKHGSGNLRYSITRKGEHVIIEIESDSPLTDKDKEAIKMLLEWNGKPKSSREGGYIGIQNVNQRVKMLYGPYCGLNIGSSAKGTLARIVLPYTEETSTANAPLVE